MAAAVRAAWSTSRSTLLLARWPGRHGLADSLGALDQDRCLPAQGMLKLAVDHPGDVLRYARHSSTLCQFGDSQASCSVIRNLLVRHFATGSSGDLQSGLAVRRFAAVAALLDGALPDMWVIVGRRQQAQLAC